jgi:uncharacterized protein YlxW (UPF0749 family)
MQSSNKRSRHRSDWLLPVTAVCIALGALTAVQVRGQEQLSKSGMSVRGGLAGRAERLVNMYDNAQRQVRELQRELYDARVKINLYEEATLYSGQLRRDLRNYKMALGLLRAKGPGIHLVLDDSAVEPADSALIIHDYDILAVVNELRGAGAEVIAVNGQRITPFTAVRCVGVVIHVNDIAIPSPYEIEAIGDPKVLASALQLPGGVLSQLKPLNIKVTLQQVDSLTLPAVTEEPKFRFARPVVEEEGS